MTHEVLIKKVRLEDSILYYQIDIMEKHPEMALLPMHVSMGERYFNLEMDISGKISLSAYLADHELTREEWIRLLIFIGETVQRGIDCFLDSSNYEISLSAIYLPSVREHVMVEDSVLLYIPVLQDSSSDTLHIFCSEMMQFLSAGIVGTSPMDRISPLPSGTLPAYESASGLFSKEENARIMSWSIDHLEDGIADLRTMMDGMRPMDSLVRKSIRTRCFKNAKLLASFKIRHAEMRIPAIFQKFSGHYPVVMILLFEIGLIAAAFRIMKLQTSFVSPLIPVLLLSGILICFSFLDLFLLFSKKSFFRCDKHVSPAGFSHEEKGADTIFRFKEEKTVLLDGSSEMNRIAMISSGIPGTLEESTGLKAYILVDDFLIGRDGAKVDFKISSLSVGRIHARITRKENSFFLEDLDSRNGTFLDQKRLKKKEEYLLPGNCKIRFAENEFYFVAN